VKVNHAPPLLLCSHTQGLTVQSPWPKGILEEALSYYLLAFLKSACRLRSQPICVAEAIKGQASPYRLSGLPLPREADGQGTVSDESVRVQSNVTERWLGGFTRSDRVLHLLEVAAQGHPMVRPWAGTL
jgi:hypothetical protein